PGDAVDEVDVEAGRGGVLADRGEGPVHVGAALRPSRGVRLGVHEALHADADPGGAAGGQHGEAVGGGGGRGGLHRGGDGRQGHAEEVFGQVVEAVQFGGGQVGGGAAAEGGPGEAGGAAERLGDRGGLAGERLQVGGDLFGGRRGAGEQVAEPAAHLAERDVEVQRQGVGRLVTPHVGEPRGVGERPVGGLVRVAVHVGAVRRVRGRCGYGMAVQGGHGPSVLPCGRVRRVVARSAPQDEVRVGNRPHGLVAEAVAGVAVLTVGGAVVGADDGEAGAAG